MTSTIDALARRFDGELVQPEDPTYDEARAVWNGLIDRRPAVIARCLSTTDVQVAIRYARQHDLPISVRGGGHNVAGTSVCDDGVVIDMGEMRSVKVDPATRTARVAAGARWADLDAATQAHGLAVTGGVDSRTGVAGLTLGGGVGFLARKHGLTIDNLLAVDLVTADGRSVRASEDENPDLFWALRGGGGNVGVVTTFEFRLHELGPEVLTAQVFHRYEDAEDVLRFHRDLMAEAPDELACSAAVVHVPPVEPFPEGLHGAPAVAQIGCYVGDVEEGRAHLDPIGSFGDPILAAVTPMPYTALQQSLDAGTPDGARYYWKSNFLSGLSDEAITTLVKAAEPLPGPFSMIGIESLGGAVNRVPTSATAWPHRDATFNLGIWAGWTDDADDEECRRWAREVHAAMEPFAADGAYVNYLDADDQDRLGEAYGEHIGRLRDIERTWDPDGLFRRDVGGTT